ncbi:MAG: hypothetical protein WD266_13200 [Balneolales bacterium]
MKVRLILLVCFAGLVTVTGCRSNKGLTDASLGDIPEWFTDVPDDPDYFFAAQTSTSRDLQTAINKATTDARAEIGRQSNVKVEGIQKNFTEEVGADEEAQFLQMFTQANRTIVSESLTGSAIRHQTQHRDGQLWRVFVLVEYPIGEANLALMEQLRQNDQMYTRFRSSQAFDELDEEIQRYEDFKRNN